MTELDNDDLVKSLEMIIQCFVKDIAPYAISLIQKLVEVRHARTHAHTPRTPGADAHVSHAGAHNANTELCPPG
jgi:hypothetical protein